LHLVCLRLWRPSKSDMPSTVVKIERTHVCAEQDCFAVDDKIGVAIAERGLNDQRVAIGPVVAVAGEEPDALSFTLNDQPVAVHIHFVQPFRPIGTLVPRVGMHGSKALVRMPG